MRYKSQNQTFELIVYTLQFQSDSLETWHTCLSGVVDVQGATFIRRVKFVIAELWLLDFVKNWPKMVDRLPFLQFQPDLLDTCQKCKS